MDTPISNIFPPGQSWQIDLRGSAETIVAQIRGLVRVPQPDKRAIADQISALWPAVVALGDDAQKAKDYEATQLRTQAIDMLRRADELSPSARAGEQYVAVKIFCRVNKIAKRDKMEKRELHLNGSIVEI